MKTLIMLNAWFFSSLNLEDRNHQLVLSSMHLRAQEKYIKEKNKVRRLLNQIRIIDNVRITSARYSKREKILEMKGKNIISDDNEPT